MKKILIFYASYGGGHLSAAKSIMQFIHNNYSDVQLEMVDCMHYINTFIDNITTGAYRQMAKKAPGLWGKIYNGSQRGLLSKISIDSNKLMANKLNVLLNEKSPDSVISTHPFSSQMVSFLKSQGKQNCMLATVMTDFAMHKQWLIGHEYTEHFFVSNNAMRQDVVDFGGGEFGLGKDRTFEVLKAIIEKVPDYQVVAVAGKNDKMKMAFEDLVSSCNAENRVRILGFTDKVPELMRIASAVVTKPRWPNYYGKFSFGASYAYY